MCTYTFTLDDRLVERIRPQFANQETMKAWLQKELELLLIHHASNISEEYLGGAEHLRLSRRIHELGMLVTGWDGQTALAPSVEALSQAAVIINHLPENILRYCAIFPTNDANVYFQGKFPAGRLTIYLNGHNMVYILKSHNQPIASNSTTVAASAIHELASTIEKHCMA